MTAESNGLRSIIESARDETGGSLKDFTVLSVQVDPYRLDTPANHSVGQWFRDQMHRLNLLHRRLHLRGIHYALLGNTILPNGNAYTNTVENWEWLQNGASKAARWLGYVTFDSIVDARNDAPVIHIVPAAPAAAWSGIYRKSDYEQPTFSLTDPAPYLSCFSAPPQPYRLAFYGEKTSLSAILSPIAERYNADVFLPTGEISDTQLYMMAKAGAEDGRRLIVFTLTDFDPSGWQMPISIGRKLQAFRDNQFPDLCFEVRPIGLTGQQARDFDLPSTPLKETECRADRWRGAMGRDQTEVDALATLQPSTLRRIVLDAVKPFVDETLGGRVRAAEREWLQAAQIEVDEQYDPSELEGFEQEAEEVIGEATSRLSEIKARADAITADIQITVPIPELPQPNIDDAKHDRPLISSDWPWAKQTAALIARKSYTDGAS